MAQNPNWPAVQVLWAPTGHIGYGTSWDSYEDFPWIDVSARTIDQWRVTRGRQYEFNQQQAGTWRGAWINTDGAFDPANTSGPYSPNVLPYRAFRVRAQWPLGGANLLTVDQATSGEGSGYGPGASPSIFGIDIFSDFSEWQVVASSTAYQGTQVCETTTQGAAGDLPFYTSYAVTAGQPYSFTIHARCLTSGQNPSAQAQILFGAADGVTTLLTVNGTAHTLTGSPTATWTTLTVSGTAPAGTAQAVFGLLLPSGTASTAQLQADGLQFENSLTPSAFAVPNPWYDVFTGGVEQYPQSWSMSGVFGKSAPTATDTFALLSQSVLGDPLTNAIFTPLGGSGPSFAYLLEDPSGSTLFADSTGQQPMASANNAQAGGGTITPGTAQTAVTIPGGEFQGAPGATVTNITSTTTPGTNVTGQPMSWIALPANAAGAIGPGGGTGLGFTRMIAFRATSAPASASAVWTAQSANGVNQISIALGNPTNFVTTVVDATHSGSAVIGTFDVGNWHLGWLGVAGDGSYTAAGIDGTINTYAASGGDFAFSGGFALDQIGCDPSAGNPRNGVFNFAGDVAFAVEWPFVLSGDQVAQIYGSWRSAWSGDTSGQRYSRILGWAGWTGPTVIDTGSSLSLGPATDLVTVSTGSIETPGAATNLVGIDAFTALQAVVDTEAGNHFVDALGRLVFKARSARYNATSPTVIFGESPPAGSSGEIPCVSISFGCDPILLCNTAQVTQESTNQIFGAQDTDSQANFGSRVRQITNQSTSQQECQDQANYVVDRYSTPIQRVASMTIAPSAMPVNWGAVLGLELAQRVRVIRRPIGAPQITFDGFVENLAHSVDTATPSWTVTLQLSPVDPTPYAVWAAMHTTVKTTASSGQATAVLNPLPDSATNSFSSYVFSGMQMTLSPGTSLSETLTVHSVSATSPGYTSVTVTFTTNLANTHAATAVACEALPALSSTTYANADWSYTPPGPTNPAQWDTTVFGAAAFAY